jgi:chromosome segregation ATPase
MTIKHALIVAQSILVGAQSLAGNAFEEGKRLLDEAATLLKKGHPLTANLKDLVTEHGTAEAVPEYEGPAEAIDPAEYQGAIARADQAEAKILEVEAQRDSYMAQLETERQATEAARDNATELQKQVEALELQLQQKVDTAESPQTDPESAPGSEPAPASTQDGAPTVPAPAGTGPLDSQSGPNGGPTAPTGQE